MESALNFEEICTFFVERMANPDGDFSTVRKESLECLTTFFFTVNQRLGKMARVPRVQYAVRYDEYDYISSVLPHEMAGFDAIWKVVLNAVDDEAVVRAMDFLAKLYLNLSQELEPRKLEVQREFVD